MGQITKTASERHDSTLSPFIKEFIEKTTSIPTRQLRSHLQAFPELWPFPRGDLYHWIPALNRFDDILAAFITTYELDKRPQSKAFGSALYNHDDSVQAEGGEIANGTSVESSEDKDEEIVKGILRFSMLLLNNCGNRSLYASSDRLNHLLNTLDISLLQSTLQLSLLLAKRYYSSKQRINAVGGSVQLSSHYNINLDRVRKLATPFAVPSPVTRQPATPSGSIKGKEKKHSRPSKPSVVPAADRKLNGSDIVGIIKFENAQSAQQWADISITVYPEPVAMAENDGDAGEKDAPESPAMQRTVSVSSDTDPRPSTNQVILHRRRSIGEGSEQALQNKPVTFDLGADILSDRESVEVVSNLITTHLVPETSHFDVLQKVRTARGLVSSKADRCTIVGIRLLAIANLAYVESETSFFHEVVRLDAEQPRQLQIASQLAELVQPASEQSEEDVPLGLQTIAITTMDALIHQKLRQNDVYTALNASVNHGILFYMLRKAVDQLAKPEPDLNVGEEEWREALFSLLSVLPQASARAGDMMMSAGLLDILLDALSARTPQADRTHWKCLTFLDNFIYQTRDGYQSLANAKGLDMVKDLSHHVVNESFRLAEAGEGMPESYKAPVTDYQIPFFQQTSLRWLFKFVNHLMVHNSGNFSRQMRNLIDSPEMLDSFKMVMKHAKVFGSNVWAGAVTIWTTFIHNEPTSYSVIAESKLGEAFLTAITSLPTTSSDSKEEIDLLPVSEAINAVPQAFQALCLNEAGMKMVIESGALGKFFKIFSSASHVKALDSDRDLPTTLGSTFDELCRHQPTLRKDISSAVRIMVSEVAKLCNTRAANDGFGAKLWVGGDNGDLYVAGGRKALAGGRQFSHAGTTHDVEMTDAGSAGDAGQMTMEEVVAVRNLEMGPFPTTYILAVARFLIGYLANSTMCSSFIQEGGLEDVLDLATSPCLPFNFELMGCIDLEEELGKLLKTLAESKVHILLPSILKRLQVTVNGMPRIYGHEYGDSFFGVFTNPKAKPVNQLSDTKLALGTAFVKAMVVISTLCNALSLVFGNSVYSHHRQSPNLFSQVNLADVWVDVIDKLGNLQRILTWEEMLLLSTLPDEWTSETTAPLTAVSADEITDRILRLPRAQDINVSDQRETDQSLLPDHDSAPANSVFKPSKDGPRNVQFENTRVLRHLFLLTPHKICHFFEAAGKTILLRRSDSIQKQNAIAIADQLAKSMIEPFTAKVPAAFTAKRHLHEFWYIALGRLGNLLIDSSYERPSPQTLTLILKSFKDQDGFAVLQRVLESYIEESAKLNAPNETISAEGFRAMADAMGGIKTIFQLYSRIINSKLVVDAQQTTAMSGRADGTYFDTFSVSQFLVEIRYAVLKPIIRIWNEPESVFMSKAIPQVVRSLIDILKTELDAEGEGKALTRDQKAPKKRQVEPRKWTPKSSSDLERLSTEFNRDLATEALFRCYDNSHNATEYCRYALQYSTDRSFFSLPKDAVAPSSSSRVSRRQDPATEIPRDDDSYNQSGEATMILDVAPGNVEVQDNDTNQAAPRLPDLNSETLRDIILNNGPSGEPDARTDLVRNLFAEVASSREISQSPAPDDRPLAGKVEGLVTVDDLNDEREQLRCGLIERCLEVLRAHDDVTFELSELIFASTSKGSGKETRGEVGSLLLMALTSFELPESPSDEELRDNDKRVTSYAHLLALVLSKDEFYSQIQEELIDVFPQLVDFVKVPTQKIPESYMAISNVLLVLERLLCDDATPHQIEYKPPSLDAENLDSHAIVELKPSLISLDKKESLFQAIMKVLPSVGQDASLALSVLRILVMLSRDRKIAVRLGEKSNMRRLFLMARQLHGMTNDRIQSAYLIILRHIIEDEETLRNIMRNEIVAAWSSRSAGRPFDTTSYARHFSQMAVRNPEVFVKATNDKVMISSYNSRQGPQQLKLKTDPATPEIASANGRSSKSSTEDETVGRDDAPDKDKMDPVEKTKSNELKMPIVENPDGVIHFILSELLDYKVVNDIESPVEKSAQSLPTAVDSTSTLPPADIEMSNASSSSTPATEGPVPNDLTSKSGKPVFKADDHPVYIYRCFLLQCLTELLSCYNQTKIEFINYKRKAEAVTTTPSKPRSQVLNYLLHDLIPTGVLGHPEDIAAKKREKTSSWAMSVIVALCSKTGEGGFTPPPTAFAEYKEEPELLFVRKFVLEHAIKSYKDATTNESERFEARFSRLLSLADLFNRMLTGKPNGVGSGSPLDHEMLMVSQRMLAKIMYEKNFISAMTNSVAEVDLNFPNAKRVVKYILKPLKLLTQTANDISMQSDNPVAPGSAEDDEIASDSEVSENENPREQTPDLFRNSALGILDAHRNGDSDESEDDDEDGEDDGMFDEYDEEMYDEEEVHDHDEVVSDEDDELTEMGPIEGLPGDVGVDMEIVGMDVEDDDETDSDGDDESEEDSDDDHDIDEEGEDMEGVLTIDEDEDGHSLGADDEDWGTEPEDEDGYPEDDEIEFHGAHTVPAELDEIVHILEGEGDRRLELLQHLEENGYDDEMPGDRGMMEGHELLDGDMEEDEEDEEEDFEEEEIAFEPEVDDEEEIEMARGMPWGWEEERGHGRHLPVHPGHRNSPWGLFTDFRDRIFPPTTAGYHRSHRGGEPQRRTDDGVNPLLQRAGALGASRAPPPGEYPNPFSAGLGRFEIPADGNPTHFINNLINAMSSQSHLITQRGGTFHVQINNPPGGNIAIPREFEQIMHGTQSSRSRPTEPFTRTSRDDPSQAVAFVPGPTMHRWNEESKILFGMSSPDKALRIVNAILRLLVPPAIEEKKRKDKEEAERQRQLEEEREKAQKEKEEQERKAKEESELRERKEREEREAREAEEAARAIGTSQVEEAMEGVESTLQSEATLAAAELPSSAADEPTERITTMIDGREIDITNLGIDPEYLAALPEEMRQEVIMEQTLANRQTQADSGNQQEELDPEFLQALPAEMREELMQQVALDRRRREREEARRRSAASGAPARADDIDAASFLATLDPTLRSQVLMEVDDESFNTLPAHLQAEARQLSGHHQRRLDHYVDVNTLARRTHVRSEQHGDEAIVPRKKPTAFLQILDKAGVATLLRLMFIPQSGSIRSTLNGILRDVCRNRQNRAEVVSILLSILQDGSNDINAVERSFSLLSLRAKQTNVLKTPQPKRATSELGSSIGEVSPITVVQQCLICIDYLAQDNTRNAEFFLSEHETGTGLKPRSTRKGKSKESKAARYPINALLSLLDRKLIIESAPAMDLLASLLQKITHPLLVLYFKEKEKKETTEEGKGEAETSTEPTAPETPAQPSATPADVEMASPDQVSPAVPADTATTEQSVERPSEEKTIEDRVVASGEEKKRTLLPPEIPEYNLRLIINIIAARECPAKTFKDTLSLITNLSTIPEAKEIFGQELIYQAQNLGSAILIDLEELLGQINKAVNSADVQGMALAKFSPASSDQAKLLRVITVLDFLFDPKRAETQNKPATADSQILGPQQKEDILTTLYENQIFATLWNRLSDCLAAIHARGNMFNVANILLPLIEVLMVVCKNTSLKDAPVKNTQNEFSLSSPEPESREARMENLFFRFTEDHRKILNELVRHSPKLMSGSFSLLVKNSKVLEFDNKRNYFSRRLHSRTNELRQPHPSLQLNVRRDQVFLDSFKHLYYKKPDEFKYGKLSIRFAGEEGVDAGGVTREWFQALTKQMFDPNYALFVPVASDRTTFHPNSESSINEQHLTFFKFIGRVIGKALYEGRVLDCHFSRALYKRILGRSISIKDMESLDNDYSKNLQWMLDNEISGIIAETFSVQTEVFGETKIVDLIADGRDVEVTDENKSEYIQRVVEYKLLGSVKEQMENFLQGFHDIVPADLVSIFNEQELELLISGLPDIDVDDWRNNTEYHNYTSSSPQIQWFWRAVRSFDKEERAKLLQFVTGTSKVPLNGFKELEGMNGFSRFNIHRDYGAKDRLPSSHTCFNQLDLPEYDGYEELRKRLYTAITTGSEYFGFA